MEIKINANTRFNYKFIDAEGEVCDNLFFTMKQIENGKVMEWFEKTGNKIHSREIVTQSITVNLEDEKNK